MPLLILIAIILEVISLILCFNWLGTNEPLNHALGWFVAGFLVFLIHLIWDRPLGRPLTERRG